jgi:hypothetical protein
VSPKDGPRDWDKELADIDKLISSGASDPPPLPAKAGAKKGTAAAAPANPAGGGRLAAMRYSRTFTWIRLVLAMLLGVGMTQWPYTHGCGLSLYGYMAAVGAVIVASTWSMISSWHSRSSLAHFLSIASLFWGLALAMREILPRTGYAKQAATWSCAVTRPVELRRPPTATQPPAHDSVSAQIPAVPNQAPPAQPNPQPSAPAADQSGKPVQTAPARPRPSTP